MTEGIRNLCMLEVINEFADSIGRDVQNGFCFGEKTAVLDVSDYRAYCVKLLSNNGLTPGRDMQEMEEFMKDVLFGICFLRGISVSATRWLGRDMVRLIR